MPNKKVIFLLVFLVLFTLVILVLKTFTNSGGKNAAASPIPVTDFHILSPSTDINTKTSITEKIKITFSKPVDPKSLELELIPVKEIKLSFDTSNTELTVESTDAWAFNTDYFIKIPQTTKSADGQALGSDYTYAFKTYPYSGI